MPSWVNHRASAHPGVLPRSAVSTPTWVDRLRWGVWPALLAWAVAACSPAATGSAGPVPSNPAVSPNAPSTIPSTRVVVMRTADGNRSTIVHHPMNVRPGAPLVVVLHPAGASARDMEANFGWDAVADRNGLVVAYPDGALDGFQDTWNGGRCCPPASDLRTDDVGFLDALVTVLRRIDHVGDEVFSVGFSNGAIMSYAWACARPGALAGIGIVAGAVMADCSSPAPITVVAVHGTVDDRIPIGGGPGPDGAAFPALAVSLDPFRTADGCGAHPEVTQLFSARIAIWRCPNGRRIVTDVVKGLDHAWPGAGPTAGSTDGPRDATGFLWANLRPRSADRGSHSR